MHRNHRQKFEHIYAIADASWSAVYLMIEWSSR